jgi:hypothetical protein
VAPLAHVVAQAIMMSTQRMAGAAPPKGREGREPTHPIRPMSMQHGMLVLPGVQVFDSVVCRVVPTA